MQHSGPPHLVLHHTYEKLREMKASGPPQVLKVWLRVSKVWLRVSKVWLRVSKVWLRVSKVWLRVSKVWLRVSKVWLRVSKGKLCAKYIHSNKTFISVTFHRDHDS